MPEAVNNLSQEEQYHNPVLEWLGWALVVLLWSLGAFTFFKLPDIIPIHFDASGAVDGYGNKLTIWLFPVIATVVYSGLTVLCRFPGIFNYPVTITEENRLFQYRNAVRFLQFLKLIIVVLFILVTWITYLAATGSMNHAPAWLLPLILSLVGLPTIFMVVRAYRNKGAASK